MKAFRLLVTCVALSLGLGSAARAEDDVRFSKTLGTDEIVALGIDQLSSDQVAVLDALVRRDLANARRITKTPPPARFSERLSEEERRNGGLERMNADQVAQLDGKVQARISPPAESFSLGSASGPYSVPSVKLRRGPEIHGSVSLMVGAGSGGYSEYGGAVTVSVEDPTSGMAVAFGYAETHSKGGRGYLYRGCRDRYWGYPGAWPGW